MFDKATFKRLIQERIENDGFIVAGDDTAWKNLTNFLSEDINASIEFLENEATPDEISWVSEVFDDIAAKTHSREFIAALHRIYDKMPEDIQQCIGGAVEDAEYYL